MKYTVKYSGFSGKLYIYLKCFGQFGETYETKEQAQEVCDYYNNQVIAKWAIKHKQTYGVSS